MFEVGCAYRAEKHETPRHPASVARPGAGDDRLDRRAYPVDSRITMGFDCLFRGLEITTGSRRINEYRMLLDNVEMFGLKPEGLADYLSIFKYGCPPHGGFAIGLERLTQKVLGLSNVKEACLFPRDRRRVRP